MPTKEQKLIKELYLGLKNFYEYLDTLEDTILSYGFDDVYDHMPDCKEDDFDYKACRFLLSEVEDYLEECE